jgi:hypothetical protein
MGLQVVNFRLKVSTRWKVQPMLEFRSYYEKRIK